MSPRCRRPLLSAAVAALLAATAALARDEPPAARPGDTLGWHVVQPGESWNTITETYLGTARLWEENWRLNPQLPDPDLLRPGQRIRVIVHRELPPRTAQVAKVERRVEKKPQPQPWSPAAVGDRLRRRDGVRTHERSSTELAFDDGSRVVITERSLVFVQEVERSLTGVARQSIEIREGQADIEARPRRADSSEIEILVGDATARPRPGAAGSAEARVRRASDDTSQLMIYGGSGEVEAAGRSVTLAQGTGTSVPKGEPPRPPERLLRAPAADRPAADATLGFANPRFAWHGLPQAASYTVEVFRDPEATRLVWRAPGLTETSWNSPALPTGALHWRVTAASDSGLDGYPSRTRALEITSDRIDSGPPTVVAVLEGSGTSDASGSVVLGPGGVLVLKAHDDASGVAELRYRWDAGDWTSAPDAGLRPPGPGAHTLEFEAADHLGQRSRSWSLRVETDETAPPAPLVERSADAVDPERD